MLNLELVIMLIGINNDGNNTYYLFTFLALIIYVQLVLIT